MAGNVGAAQMFVDQYLANQQGGTTQNRRDAEAYISSVFKMFGLPDSLNKWAFELIKAGASADKVLLDLYDRPEFNQRFPAIKEMRDRGLNPPNPQQYIEYENTAREIAHKAGLPPGFLGDKQMTALISGQVSPSELQGRIDEGYAKVRDADPAVREAFRSYFGVNGDQALATYFLDPEHGATILEEQVRMAEIAGIGHEWVGGWLTAGRSAKLAENGVTAEQARAGFEQIAAMEPLFRETVSERNDLSIEREGVSATFGVDTGENPVDYADNKISGKRFMGNDPLNGQDGENRTRFGMMNVTVGGNVEPTSGAAGAGPVQTAAQAKAAIERRRSSRTAAFKGGGGANETRSGTGLGSAE